MCTTCGCGDDKWRIHAKPTDSEAQYQLHTRSAADAILPGMMGHHHPHGHGPHHRHDKPSDTRTLAIERDVLARNDAIAAVNRQRFAARGQFAVNLVSSPGSGKTTLVIETAHAWRGRTPIAVIEGDQQTSLDADRVRAAGIEAVQINTAKGCHLDAQMVARALDELVPADESLLLIENVGNLVCPAGFDLGEAHKVVVLSVTEGEDKPLKYPDMFHAADVMILNKADLLPYVDFDVAKAIEYARRVQPRIEAFVLSARTGEGFDAWLSWLDAGAGQAKRARRQMSGTVEAGIA